MDVASLFRQRVRELILAKYRSLDRFYLETGFSKGHLSEILRGRSSPSVDTLIKLAKALEVDVCEFFLFPDKNERDRAVVRLLSASPEMIKNVLELLRG